MHAKWSPVSTCIMHKKPIVALDDDKINRQMPIEQRKEMVAKCPRKVYKFNELKQVVEIENMSACNLCIECYRYAESVKIDNAITITEDDQKFYFTIESTGAIPPVQIVKKAFVILKTKINNFS